MHARKRQVDDPEKLLKEELHLRQVWEEQIFYLNFKHFEFSVIDTSDKLYSYVRKMNDYQGAVQSLFFSSRYASTKTSGAFQLMQTSFEAKLASWSR